LTPPPGQLPRPALDVRPHQAVFVDDSDRCVAGARQAGIHAIRYTDNAQAIEEIEQLLTSL